MTFSFIFWMDILGTIAFAISGAVIAIQKEMDIFGVNILAVATATGGGMIRDIMIGRTPPMMFRNPEYALLSVITANIVFVVLYTGKFHLSARTKYIYELLLFLTDTLGLAAFTVDGVYAGWTAGTGNNLFLTVVLGVLTGVGGGVIRDVLSLSMPAIFVKHVYACAAIVGAMVCGVLMQHTQTAPAMLVAFLSVILIRVLAAHFRWNLPRIRKEL